MCWGIYPILLVGSMVQLTHTIKNETIAQNTPVITKATIAPKTGSLCAISKKIPSQKRKYPNAIKPVLCAVDAGEVAYTRTKISPNIRGVADKTDHHPLCAFIESSLSTPKDNPKYPPSTRSKRILLARPSAIRGSLPTPTQAYAQAASQPDRRLRRLWGLASVYQVI